MIKRIFKTYWDNIRPELIINMIIVLPICVIVYGKFIKMSPSIPFFDGELKLLFGLTLMISVYNFLEFLINPIFDEVRKSMREKMIQRLMDEKTNQYKIGTYVMCKQDCWNKPYSGQVAKIINVGLDNSNNVYVNIYFLKKHLNDILISQNGGGGRFSIGAFNIIPEEIQEKNYEDWCE